MTHKPYILLRPGFQFLILHIDPSDPNFSPILFPSNTNLPPLVVLIAGLDPLRDENFLYQKLLEKEGIKMKAFAYVSPNMYACAQ